MSCDRFFSQKEVNIPQDLREIWDSIVDISVRCELVKKKTVIFSVGNPHKGIDRWGDADRCASEGLEKAKFPLSRTVAGMEVNAQTSQRRMDIDVRYQVKDGVVYVYMYGQSQDIGDCDVKVSFIYVKPTEED